MYYFLGLFEPPSLFQNPVCENPSSKISKILQICQNSTDFHKPGSETNLVVRKDLKSRKSGRTHSLLSKKPKIKRIGRENNSGAVAKRSCSHGGGSTNPVIDLWRFTYELRSATHVFRFRIAWSFQWCYFQSDLSTATLSKYSTLIFFHICPIPLGYCFPPGEMLWCAT